MHAHLSASGAHRWLLCPGSPALARGMPEYPTMYAAWGSVAHTISAQCLNLDLSPEAYLGETFHQEGFSVACDREMVDAVGLYVGAVREAFLTGNILAVEKNLDGALSRVHPDLGGTADAIVYRESEALLITFDAKFGAGKSVEPENNEQLMIYALGALLGGIEGAKAKRVRVVIVQPRLAHADGYVRSAEFDAVELLDFAADLCDAARATEALDAPRVPGTVQCRWCKAAPKCPELRAEAQELAMRPDFGAVMAYDAEELARVLRMVPRVRSFLARLDAFAYGEQLRGNDIPGFKLVAKRPTRRWRSEEEVILWGRGPADISSEVMYRERELKSPAQMEKLLEGQLKSDMAQFVVKESSGLVLVPVEDPRPEAAPQLTADAFEAIESTNGESTND